MSALEPSSATPKTTADAPRARRLGLVLGALALVLGAVVVSALDLGLPLAVTLALLAALAAWAIGRGFDLDAALRDERAKNAAARVDQASELRVLAKAKQQSDAAVAEQTLALRRATEQLSDTLQSVRALDRARTDFFQNVSHELRSPLTLIVAPLQDLVAGRVPAGGQRAAIEAMHRNSLRLLHLINQLLDLAKLDAGRMRAAPVHTDLTLLCTRTLDRFRNAAEQRKVQLTQHGPELACWIGVDPSWIDTALVNLIANALRFSPEGGEIALTVQDRGNEVVISVSDQGPGIAPEEHAKIFERFGQADQSASVIGGTGIGLALVREAARLHDGDASLASELGHGATFRLTLPRRVDVVASPADVSPQQAPAFAPELFAMQDSVEPIDLPGPTRDAPLAIVVEDNSELRAFVADVLNAHYQVKAVATGAEAVALAEALDPAVIVTDVAMPGMDGHALCRELRSMPRTRATPILLVTARTEIGSVLEGFEAGANDYVLKPFHGRELLARVNVHVGMRRLAQDLALSERHAMLGVMAASIAHQVRNPLTTLVAGLPAMRARIRERADRATVELIDVMIDCADRIERLTRDLMDISRVDREPSGAFSPSDGLRSAIRLAKARVLGTVTIDDQVQDCCIVEGRPGDINHVFLNLLDNAIRAVGDSGRIRITAASDGASYVARIADSGRGIDQALVDRIFEPFFTTRSAGEGTGLGLSIARQIVRQHGGEIEVNRCDLGGAEFTVRLPTSERRRSQPTAVAS
jgi:signal transduction histidine kinase